MFRIPCPHCGLRDVSEFRHLGEAGARPDPQTADPQQWRTYLYGQRNVAGWSAESWYHALGCRRFVSVERHTVTNETRPGDGAAGPGHPASGAASADAGAPDADSTA